MKNSVKTKFDIAKEKMIWVEVQEGDYTPEYMNTPKGRKHVGNRYHLKYAWPERVSLLEFMIDSKTEVCSPRSSEWKYFIRENTNTVCEWTHGKSREVESFDNELDAENFLFEILEEEFHRDEMRSTKYYETKEECEVDCADVMDMDLNVYRSYMKHKQVADKIREQRREEERRIFEEKSKVLSEKREAESDEIANLIEKVEGESYKETAARLSTALGRKVQGFIFHEAVKKVRK